MKECIKPIRKYIILELVFDAICTILCAFMPILQKELFDEGLAEGAATIMFIVVAYIIVQVLHTIFEYLCMLVTWKGAILFEKGLKHNFFESLFSMEHDEFCRKPVAEYVSLQGSDITALEQDYLQPMVDIVRSVNMLIIYSVVMYWWVDWRIMITVFLASLVAVIGPKLTGERVAEKRNSYQKQMASYVSGITDLLEGFSLINNQTRKNISDVHEKMLAESANKRYAYGKGKTLSLSVNQLSIKFIRIAAFLSAGILLLQGEITIGTGVAVFGYVDSFISPINSLLYDVNALWSVKKIKERFLEYTDTKTPVSKPIAKKLEHGIELTHMSCKVGDFRIDDVSFLFEKGKKYAIVGHSGSGKSTLLKVIMGYIPPEQGKVLIDGSSSTQIDMSELIDYTEQSAHIFRAGFNENVTIFDSYTMKYIDDMGKDIKTLNVVRGKEDNCQELSGGEKQTVAFLRMLAKDTSVVLLDEPFSALDAGSKSEMEKFLLESQLISDKMVIVVTHDISDALQRYDEVLLMENGRLKVHGPYNKIKSYLMPE